MINRNIKYLFLILFLASCGGEKPAEYEKMPSLYAFPRIVALNTGEGYFINPVTGDSIRPIMNSLGDTLKTGVPVPAIGKVINPNSVSQPKVFPAGKAAVVPTNLNVHKIPQTLTIITVNKDSLKPFTSGIGNSLFVLVNSTGDTIPTGVPIPAKGKDVPYIQPKPVEALPPHLKDNASINMKYLDVDHGLNSSYVLSILEDSNGNLWFGTEGGGVSRYDGESFMHFTTKEGLASDGVYSIFEDSHGNLWFGGRGAISIYNGNSFTHFTEKEGLSDKAVWTILEDSHGNLWFGTEGGGVTMYNGESFTHFTTKEGLSNNFVMSILEDSKGNLWIATRSGVSMYNGKTFMHFTKKDGLSDNYVLSLLEDSYGNLWFGTNYNGVSKYNGKTFTHFTENEGLSNNSVWSIMEDRHNNIWFGTKNGGVSMYNGETFTNFTTKEGLSNDFVPSILGDSHGNLWFGTYGGGVSIYNGNSFKHYTEKEGLSNIVWSILEDRKGNLWIGTGGAGVSKYDGETFTRYTEKEGLSNKNVHCILEDRKGCLWFGTDGGGAFKYSGEYFTHYTEKEGLSNIVWSILEDNNGNLWFGTFDGVYKYNGEIFTHFTEKDGLISNRVYSILEDQLGNLWFGTLRGVSMYDGKAFTHFTEKEGLSNNYVWPSLEDTKGNLWFGTDKGVSVCNGEALLAGQASFTHFTEKDGLSNNIVWSIVEDSNNNIWLSTEKGLNLFVFDSVSVPRIKNSLSLISGVKEDYPEVTFYNPVIHTFGLQDGLRGMNYYPSSVLLDSENRIWWGSGKSLTMLDMNNFELPSEPPTLEINRVEIGEKFFDYHNLIDNDRIEFDSVSRFYNYPINLRLPYNRNHLTFYFSATDWSAPHKIKYTYKIEGLDDNWSTPSSEPMADYRNLPFGIYTLKVSAIGESQEWSTPLEYTFTINPPWWQTWWSRAGYLIAAILLVIFYVNQRTKKLKQSQKELEQKVKERTAEIQEQKEVIEDRNKKITDSIQYAKIIQDSILIKQEELEEVIPDSFVYFKPRDIVSGDFYWITRQKGCVIIAAVDCTGHGVPGGFMSMIGNTLLNLIVKERGIIKPSDILDNLNEEVIKALQQEHSASLSNDGMDIAVCTIDYNNEDIQFSGAKNPLLMIIDNELHIIKADPFSVGGSLVSKKKRGQLRFNNQVIKLTKGASLYLFSDGYVDQFGGIGNKSYNTSRLSNLLLSVSKLTPSEQYRAIEQEMNEWMKSTKQIDDMLIIGMKL